MAQAFKVIANWFTCYVSEHSSEIVLIFVKAYLHDKHIQIIQIHQIRYTLFLLIFTICMISKFNTRKKQI